MKISINEMLQNKKIVIIGGTTGIGLSAAKAFVAAGAQLVLVGRNPDSCEQAKNILGDKGRCSFRRCL